MPSMMSPVVSSLVYSKKRRTVTEVFPPNLRKLWKEWDLRCLVLLSLTLQVALIILGNRRKYNHRLWIIFVTWSAYLAADYVASCALGVLSNNLADLRHHGDRSLDANIELTALWAPFLLLHLGGPDTITAYALEDNELWLRHLLALIFQAGTTFYVLLMAWTGSYLSVIFISMFCVGLIKYGERNWVLRSVSNKKLGESIQDDIDDLSHKAFTFEKGTKSNEGYHVEVQKLPESCVKVDFSVSIDNSISDEDCLCIAHGFSKFTKCLFLDAILGSNDKESSISLFKNISSKSAFKIVETELGFMYDLFYTKAPLLRTPLGLCLRLITFFLICLTCSLLLIFSFLDHKHKHSKVDISVTFILFFGAIILEMYSALLLVSSDRFVVWLNQHNKISTLRNLSSFFSFPLFKSRSWSNTMAQYSFIKYCLKVKPLRPYYISVLKLLNMEKRLEKRRPVVYKDVSDDIKDMIFQHCRTRAIRKNPEYSSITSGKSGEINGKKYPTFDEDLGKCFLFWHIVTEVLYNIYPEEIKHSDDNTLSHRCDAVKCISEYMLYLLVVNPTMLSTGNQRFQKTADRTEYILKGKTCKDEKQASEVLMASLSSPEGQGSNLSLLKEALSCADNLAKIDISNEKLKLREKCDIICEGWLEILTYAASRCNQKHHAQQLRNGGELLTHVWLLMAHFGLTSNFQISREPHLTRLIST